MGVPGSCHYTLYSVYTLYMLNSKVSGLLYLDVPGVGENKPDQPPGHTELHPGGAGLLSPVD